MFHRRTQTQAYWEQDFRIEPDDLDHVSNLLLEVERPLPLEELAKAVVRRRVELEESELQKLLSKGKLYRPMDSYEVGDRLVFPALQFTTGVVIDHRPGQNPEYGEFAVMRVRFDPSGKERSFASALQQPHTLNGDAERLVADDAALMTVDELTGMHLASVTEPLGVALGQQDDLVQLFGLWFLRALLSEVGPGYLNIAEAILDISGGGPLPADELLRDMGLPAESRPELLEFSLNYALFQDTRFDEVGPAGQVLWYLQRLEPQAVLTPPPQLAYEALPYDRNLLSAGLRKLERELDDEWSAIWQPEADPDSNSIVLTFPHRSQGTLPLSSRLALLFPTSYEAPRIRATLVDKNTGQEIEAWVVWEGRYVYGLEAWYREFDLPAGAVLSLEPGPEPGIVYIVYGVRRPQSEWVRVAQVRESQLVFGMQKRALACVYDHMMTIGIDQPESVEAARLRLERQDRSIAEIIVSLFPDLAKLSPQSTVHAKTLYSAVNMVKRCPPGPIFAELVRQPCFISMGENYWRFNPSLWPGRVN